MAVPCARTREFDNVHSKYQERQTQSNKIRCAFSKLNGFGEDSLSRIPPVFLANFLLWLAMVETLFMLLFAYELITN
eukprot:5859907-Amphidinium_carterae.1